MALNFWFSHLHSATGAKFLVISVDLLILPVLVYVVVFSSYRNMIILECGLHMIKNEENKGGEWKEEKKMRGKKKRWGNKAGRKKKLGKKKTTLPGLEPGIP